MTISVVGECPGLPISQLQRSRPDRRSFLNRQGRRFSAAVTPVLSACGYRTSRPRSCTDEPIRLDVLNLQREIRPRPEADDWSGRRSLSTNGAGPKPGRDEYFNNRRTGSSDLAGLVGVLVGARSDARMKANCIRRFWFSGLRSRTRPGRRHRRWVTFAPVCCGPCRRAWTGTSPRLRVGSSRPGRVRCARMGGA